MCGKITQNISSQLSENAREQSVGWRSLGSESRLQAAERGNFQRFRKFSSPLDLHRIAGQPEDFTTRARGSRNLQVSLVRMGSVDERNLNVAATGSDRFKQRVKYSG